MTPRAAARPADEARGREVATRASAAEWAALVALLILAATLRFVALDRDFRFGGPSFDELHNFIQPVHWMWERGSADPHVYSGYPGLFNHLIFVPVTLAREQLGLEAAYVAARAVVAAFGVVNVLLAWLLGRGLFGPLPALLGAALMTCSRVGIREAHQISPDVLVATGLLALLLVHARCGESSRGDLAAGVVVGVATAIKYTGLMLLPALVVGALAQGRLRRLPQALGAALLAFALAAPYAVLGGNEERGTGLVASLDHYFEAGPPPETGVELPERLGLRALLPLLREDLGGAVPWLVGLGFLLWRPWVPLLAPAAVVASSVAVMALATMTFPRHALVPLAATGVLAMAGLAGVMARLPPRLARIGGSAILLGSLVAPAGEAADFLARMLQPSGARLTQAWLSERLDGPARVATSLYGLPLPRDRFEVRSQLVLRDYDPAFLGAFDAIVAREGSLRPDPGWSEAVRFATPETPAPLVVWRPAPRPRPVRAPEPSSVSASADPGGAWRAFDGDAASAWSAGSGRGWIEARWEEPLLIGRVEVDAGEHWPQRLRLRGGSGDERQFLVAPRLRPRFGQLEGVPAGQFFVLTPPRRLEALRLVRPQGAQWSVAELRVYLAAPR